MPLQIESGNGFALSHVAIQANDMVWDPVTQQIYLSVLSTDGAHPNTITTLNPLTGQLGVSQDAGGQPDRLALSSDDSYLYAGIDGIGYVQRFTLPDLHIDITIPLGSDSNGGLYDALGLEAAPGSPRTIAVLRGKLDGSPVNQGGIAIYDDSVPRPVSVPGVSTTSQVYVDTMQWGSDAAHLYGESDNQDDLYVMSVDASGVQLSKDYPEAFLSNLGLGPFVLTARLHYNATTGYLYSDDGQVVDPASGKAIGTYGTSGAMTTDGTLQLAYFLGQPPGSGGNADYTLTAFDLSTFAPIHSIVIPSVAGTPVKLIRWGADGLAILTNNSWSTPSNPIPGMGVYLISGTFVTSPGSVN